VVNPSALHIDLLLHKELLTWPSGHLIYTILKELSAEGVKGVEEVEDIEGIEAV
jgi:hypothetical protein